MSHSTWIRWLDAPVAADGQSLAELGGKGANLARLRALGLPAPTGFVITTAAYDDFVAANRLARGQDTDPSAIQAAMQAAPMPGDLRAAILAAYQQMGTECAVAVRSSGTAEDLATASFAGQHDTFLNVVGPDALLRAVQACWASLWTPRAVAYRRQSGWDAPSIGAVASTDGAQPLALAVVVQVMVQAAAAGVVFTANPVTGARTETTISAVRGLGERLVSGEGATDEWVVRGRGQSAQVSCRRVVEHALVAEQALAVAMIAWRIENQFGAPQDVEWAIDMHGALFVLQARPMTALPEPLTWVSPTRGGWMRNFRLGEWLPEPVTPLCETWLIAGLEQGEVNGEERDYGLRLRLPYHVLANGWYFSAPVAGGVSLSGILNVLTHHPQLIAMLALSTRRPDFGEQAFIAPVARRWREETLPRYQRLVAAWEAREETASLADLVAAIDQIVSVGGDYLWDLSVSGGHAWKAEHALARFYRRRLAPLLARAGGAPASRGHQDLLLGLPAPFPVTPPHAVQSLDWIRPTLGDDSRGPLSADDLAERRAQMGHARQEAEAACRKALARESSGRRRRFETLLALAQRYATLREEQAGWFTLGWPFMRRSVLRLGAEAQQRGMIAQAEDVFFLTKGELAACLGDAQPEPRQEAERIRSAVTARQRQWERQRRLTPPLTLGNPLSARVIARVADGMRAPSAVDATGASHASDLRGMPASPGRATGPVRVVRGPEDFARFQPGEVLVAQVTAPAWTPLFGLAAAVVTDGGSLAAHASLVAREYGIPAVVGVGDATERLRDGQRVTVDGSAGIVETFE
jgi:pyruvate,water dikinase